MLRHRQSQAGRPLVDLGINNCPLEFPVASESVDPSDGFDENEEATVLSPGGLFRFSGSLVMVTSLIRDRGYMYRESLSSCLRGLPPNERTNRITPSHCRLKPC
jgi:hypothetical protein